MNDVRIHGHPRTPRLGPHRRSRRVCSYPSASTHLRLIRLVKHRCLAALVEIFPRAAYILSPFTFFALWGRPSMNRLVKAKRLPHTPNRVTSVAIVTLSIAPGPRNRKVRFIVSKKLNTKCFDPFRSYVGVVFAGAVPPDS